MLRPATPLTVLLLTSFVLLLLSVLSTPIIKGVPIANRKGVNFGVFGYCTPTECSGPRIGYNTDDLFGDDTKADFKLPSAARHSLSALLVVHPIAALFNLICLGLAGAAHLHSPSHSARYLLALLILLLPTLLVTLLAFLVDILLFVPHLQWGGWIVLASTILITASGVVTCAMRRTLVSRKARKKRIAENAEMSGENFFNRQNALPKIEASSPRTSSGEPQIPMVNGAPGSNMLPAFATYKTERDTAEERTEMSGRTLSNRMDGGVMGYRGVNGEALGPVRSRSQEQHRLVRDEYGSLPPSSNVLGAAPPNLRRDPSDPNLRQRPSREHTNGFPVGPRGGLGYGGPRGRGGYPPRGAYGPPRAGFGGPRGGPNPAYGRGGYNDGRGNYHTGRGRGGTMAAGIGAGMAAGAMIGRPQQGPPPGYPPQGQRVSTEGYNSQDDLRQYPSPAYGGVQGGRREPSPGVQMRRPSPETTTPVPPGGSSVGQAVEMTAATGRMSQAANRPQDGEILHNMVTMPPTQSRDLPNASSPSSEYSSPGVSRPPNMGQPPDLVSPSSTYSYGHDNYVPPRAAWASNSRTNSLIHNQPATPSNIDTGPSPGSTHNRPRAPSSHYYEDVDPRFSDVYIDPSFPLPPPGPSPTLLPTSLTPGPPRHTSPPHAQGTQPTFTEETLQDGARSPTGSEVSHFTSVSQRGVNPRWRPGSEDLRSMPRPQPSSAAAIMRKPIPAGGLGAPPGAPTPRDTDVLLQNNPDFEIPGMRPPGRAGGVGGAISGGAQPGGPMQSSGNAPLHSLTGVGRYPQP